MHSPANVRVSKPAINPKSVYHAKRPPIACVRQNLSSNPILILAKAVADSLRVVQDFFSGHFLVSGKLLWVL